jgi:hypothetical protein
MHDFCCCYHTKGMRRVLSHLLFLAILAIYTQQPGNGQQSGVASQRAIQMVSTFIAYIPASSCVAAAVSNASYWSGNYSANYNNHIKRNLTYSTSTGTFSGTLITNGCPRHASTYSGAGFSTPKFRGSPCQRLGTPV